MVRLANWIDKRDELAARGVVLPGNDVAASKEAGAKQPRWIHVGGGNLYRAFHAEIAQDALDQGGLDRGVVVVETFSPFTIDEVYPRYGNDILQVIMNEDGTLSERILASTAAALFCNPKRPDDYKRCKGYFESPELQMVTLTITEKGYALRNAEGAYLPYVADEIAAGPEGPSSTMGIIAAMLYARYQAGAAPIALVSTDNFSQNGRRFRDAVLDVVMGWRANGKVDQGFVSYVSDEGKVSFPWSMIDRITPNPAQATADALASEGWEDLSLIPNGPVNFAGFSNTEQTHYLVVEDSFPNGRPALEQGGVIMTDRATVDKADTMKVTACLNPLHTGLAVYGCLLGYTKIADEMRDAELSGLVNRLGYDEGLPVVVDPGVINPKEFIDVLVEHRLPNPSLPDAPQRIAQDTSQKMSIRYGHTLNAYIEAGRSVDGLVGIPLVIAGWMRYLLAIDDNGSAFEPSPDPMLAGLQAHLDEAGLAFGATDAGKIHAALEAVLSNREIFGCNLYEVGLGERVERYFAELNAAPGAVRETLRRHLAAGAQR